MAFLTSHVSSLLLVSFPNLTQTQVTPFVAGLFDLNIDLPTFKTHLRNFLIELTEFQVEDNQGLFDEEKQKGLEESERRQMEARQAVPGMLKPSEIQGEMDDDL